ncbi:hypothetical protein MRB53_035484 [Persea americana]|uniref:Uncharacterized protein n=1 Tax=Persea americana TaxID=3435 RepID=A0ACC2K595_PERAE|nr:hypothetical protein MRB53_035484 [Persea americana]
MAQEKVAVKVQTMTDARTKKKALEIIAGIQRNYIHFRRLEGTADHNSSRNGSNYSKAEKDWSTRYSYSNLC